MRQSSNKTASNIKQYKPTNLNDLDFKNSISNNEVDVLVVVAYGNILPKWLLDIPSIMPVNIHFSLLPKYRGAAPVNHAILNGETETGLTTFLIQKKVDTGDLLLQQSLPIDNSVTTGEALSKLSFLNLISC